MASSVQTLLIVYATVFGGVFLMVGMRQTIIWLKTIQKVRKGHIEAFFATDSHQIKSKLVKPKTGEFETDGKTLRYNSKSGNVLFRQLANFSVPTAYYDQYGNQINFSGAEQDSKLDAETLNATYRRVYNLGKLIAFQELKRMLMILLVLGVIMIVNMFVTWDVRTMVSLLGG